MRPPQRPMITAILGRRFLVHDGEGIDLDEDARSQPHVDRRSGGVRLTEGGLERVVDHTDICFVGEVDADVDDVGFRCAARGEDGNEIGEGGAGLTVDVGGRVPSSSRPVWPAGATTVPTRTHWLTGFFGCGANSVEKAVLGMVILW